jgi:hypothetical protein
MKTPQPNSAHPWAPHPKAPPLTEREGDAFCTAANGTRTLSGGWQLEYEDVEPNAWYQFAVDVEYNDLATWRDALQCKVLWYPIAPDDEHCSGTWDSCIIDRKGEFLAYNDGTRDFVEARVPLADGYRTWNGGCFREVNWLQRRPHLYGAYVEAGNTGSL